MNSVQKIILSLLVAVVAGGVFAFFAFSGAFNGVEARFYSENALTRADGFLAQTAGFYNAYKDRQIRTFRELSSKSWVVPVFKVNQSKADIQDRENTIQSLLMTGEIEGIRFADIDGRINYSTKAIDIDKQSPDKVQYVPKERLNSSIEWDKIYLKDKEAEAAAIDPQARQLILSVPVRDGVGAFWGTMITYVDLGPVAAHFRQLVSNETSDMIFIDGQHAVLNMPKAAPSDFIDTIKKNWGKKDSRVIGSSGIDVTTRFISVEPGLSFAYLVPSASLMMPDTLRVVLVSLVFLTLFLLVFLLLNIRQDPVVVLAQRVKRLQLSLLENYLEKRGTMDEERWQAELRSRRDDVHEYIKRGLGKRKAKRPEVDAIIDRGWDEILSILGATKPVEVNANVDVQKLENLIQKVLSSWQPIVDSGAPIRSRKSNLSGTGNSRPLSKTVEADAIPTEEKKAPTPITVEELPADDDMEEMEALEEVEDVEELDDLEGDDSDQEADQDQVSEKEAEETSTDDQVEDVEELEDLDEAETTQKADDAQSPEKEIIEVAPADEEIVAELEDVAELESLEPEELSQDLESVTPEAEPELSKAEEIEELDTLPDTVAVQETDDALVDGELEELSELEEEVEEAIPVETAPNAAFAEKDVAINLPFVIPVYDTNIPAAAIPQLSDKQTEEIDNSDATELEEIKEAPYIPMHYSDEAFIGMIDAAGPYDELRMRFKNHVDVLNITSVIPVKGGNWRFNESDEGVIQIPQSVYAEVGDDEGWRSFGESWFDGAASAQPFALEAESRSYYRTASHEQPKILGVHEGLDLEAYMKNFRPDEGGRIKAVFALSKRVEAEFLLLGQFGSEGFSIERKVGLQELNADTLPYLDSDLVFADFINDPAFVCVRDVTGFFNLMECGCGEIRGYSSVVVVPVLYAQAQYHILLGYSMAINLQEYVDKYIKPLLA